MRELGTKLSNISILGMRISQNLDLKRCFSICDVGMSSISKPDHCTERPRLVLLSAYQEYLMTFKLMTLQVVQRARLLITHICVIGAQRVKTDRTSR